MARIEQILAEQPTYSSRALAAFVLAECGLSVHPRSIERALVRRREAPKTRS